MFNKKSYRKNRKSILYANVDSDGESFPLRRKRASRWWKKPWFFSLKDKCQKTKFWLNNQLKEFLMLMNISFEGYKDTWDKVRDSIRIKFVIFGISGVFLVLFTAWGAYALVDKNNLEQNTAYRSWIKSEDKSSQNSSNHPKQEIEVQKSPDYDLFSLLEREKSKERKDEKASTTTEIYIEDILDLKEDQEDPLTDVALNNRTRVIRKQPLIKHPIPHRITPPVKRKPAIKPIEPVKPVPPDDEVPKEQPVDSEPPNDQQPTPNDQQPIAIIPPAKDQPIKSQPATQVPPKDKLVQQPSVQEPMLPSKPTDLEPPAQPKNPNNENPKTIQPLPVNPVPKPDQPPQEDQTSGHDPQKKKNSNILHSITQPVKKLLEGIKKSFEL